LAISAAETMPIEYAPAADEAYIRLAMTSKPHDLTWQSNYAREYARTSGHSLSFGPADAGGMYMVTIVGGRSAVPLKKRMRREDCIAATGQLRNRPNCLW
jgi:hypothetical protein